MSIRVTLDRVLLEKRMSLTELSERGDMTPEISHQVLIDAVSE